MHRIKTFVPLIGLALLASAQTPPPAGAPVRMIITVGHSYGKDLGPLSASDVVVSHGFEKLPIVSLTPLRGDQSGLELFVIVDNCSSCEVGNKFEELARFLRSRPAPTEIGVAYIQNGELQIAQAPTRDRTRALAALNPPSGSKPSNPFRALKQLIDSWPADSSRHAVLMISNGIDPNSGEFGPNKPAEEAIATAQRAGVVVFSIYHPSADYADTSFSTLYGGQIQLAHVSNETGGESYLLGASPLPTLAPFLSDIADHLGNQYLLEFMANPGDKGGFQDITVSTKLDAFELMAPARVWVPGLGANDLKRYTSGQ